MTIPGGKMSARPLHFFWVLDCSGSMFGERVGALNNAIRESLPHIIKVADENPGIQVFVRALKFGNSPEWVIKDPVKIEDFFWDDLKIKIGEMTNLGLGISLLIEALDTVPERALPSVIVLVCDGQITDDYKKPLSLLNTHINGKNATKASIAIGKDTDTEALQDFIGKDSPIKPVQANNPQDLVEYIKVVSTRAVQVSSQIAKDKNFKKISPVIEQNNDDDWV